MEYLDFSNKTNYPFIKIPKEFKTNSNISQFSLGEINFIQNKNSIIMENTDFINEGLGENFDVKSWPILELEINDSLYEDINTKITISPISINEKPHTLGKKFIFGKNLETNSFNFSKKENVYEKQFEIIYDITNLQYKLRDCAKGTGVFVNLKRKVRIDSRHIISFSNTHLLVFKTHHSNKLKFKFIQGPLKDKIFIFNPEKFKIVRVGRNSSNEVQYNCESVSRVQCTFKHEEDGYWYIHDGDIINQSRNGLWILASLYITLENNMLFKTGNTTFRANLKI